MDQHPFRTASAPHLVDSGGAHPSGAISLNLHRRLAAACLVLGLAFAPGARAQLASSISSRDVGQDRPRIGVALSGGSAKGFAHVGVLRVLEELGIPVDLVTGTSMGSLVGGLYAAGYAPDDVLSRLEALDWTVIFTDARDRADLTVDRRMAEARALLSFPIRNGQVGFPTGVVRGERGTRALERLTWPVQAVRDFKDLPVPFAAVATDIETGEAVVLRDGSLAEAIRASIAIPGVIRPLRLGDRLLVDGAVSRNLPAQDARAMGADIVICSDVSDPLEQAEDLSSLFDILLQTVAFRMQASTERQRALCDVLIDVNTEGLSSFAFDRGREWAARGELAARALGDTLLAIRQRVGPAAPPPRPPHGLLPDSLTAARIEIQGVTGRDEELALRTIGIRDGAQVSAGTLDRALGRLYGTDLFDQAMYRVEVESGDTAVSFQLVPQPQDALGFGFRFDDHRKASLLFSGTLHNVLGFGTTTVAELRLGEQLQAGVRAVRGFGLAGRFSLSTDLRYTRALFDLYDGGRQVAEARARVTNLSAFMGTTLGRTAVAGIRLSAERAAVGTVISPSDTSRTVSFWSVTGRILRDTFDRSAFPTRGLSLLLSSEWADRSMGSGASFRLHVGRVEQLLPLGERTTLRVGVMAGYAEGDDLPLHRLFFLGGVYPSGVLGETQPAFPGLKPQERRGHAVQVATLGVQRRLGAQVFITAGLHAGNTFDTWRVAPEDYLRGWSLALGALTPLGPVEATLAGREGGGAPSVSVNLGFSF